MPSNGDDQYQGLPGYQNLTFMDHLRAGLLYSDQLQRNDAGMVYNPKLEFLRAQGQQRMQEAAAAQAQQPTQTAGGE